MPTINKMIQVKFTETVSVNGQSTEFTDALYLTPAEDATITEEELATRMNERIDAFVDRLENPPEVPEPTPEELEQQALDIQAEIDNLTAQLDAVQAAATVKREEIKLK
jgi:hypothetical protein